MLSRDDILAIDDRPIETITIPEWGGEVGIRALSGAERDAIEAEYQGEDGAIIDRKQFRAAIAARSLCDEQGSRIFTREDIEGLADKNGDALTRIANHVMVRSAMDEHALERAEKNSDGGQAAYAGTASP